MDIIEVTSLKITSYGATGEDWTPDLVLTKDALYHWATAAKFSAMSVYINFTLKQV